MSFVDMHGADLCANQPVSRLYFVGGAAPPKFDLCAAADSGFVRLAFARAFRARRDARGSYGAVGSATRVQGFACGPGCVFSAVLTGEPGWSQVCQRRALAPLTLAAFFREHLLNAVDATTKHNLPRLNPAPELAARFFGRPPFRRRRHPVVVLRAQTSARASMSRLPGHVRAGRWIIINESRRPIE